MTARPITNKKRMYELLANGGLGNAVEQWFSLEDWLRDGPHPPAKLYAIRSLRPGGLCEYDLPARIIPACCLLRDEPYNISPMQPDWAIQIQGEVCRDPDLRLFYSLVRKPMRVALREGGVNVRGAVAAETLRHYLDPSSHADLEALLDRYPDHAVEFSTYRVGVGRDKRRKTVFWECRKY